MKRLLIPLLLALLLPLSALRAQTAPKAAPTPDKTLCFAHRDTCDLWLDYYAAAPGSGPSADSLRKPVVIHIFGGAFAMGSRNQPADRVWYRRLADEGYHVVAIDYRLGMKGVRVSGLSGLPILRNAIQMAVDDLLSATNYLIDHAEALAIDIDRIVVSGSSAGAMTALQAEWEICNGMEPARVLPDWFNFAGIMAFSGAIFSTEGAIRFPQKPCPVLLFHGTADRIVPYGQISLPGKQFAGGDGLAKKFKDIDANFQIYRFRDAGHEISATMPHNLPEELRFLEMNVIRGIHRPLDALVQDTSIPTPDWAKATARDLYK